MKYYVKGEYIDAGSLLPPQQLVRLYETTILPSLEAIANLEEERKIIVAGAFTGDRAGVFIVEAESNEEVSKLLIRLPFWGLVKWEVIPLDSFRNRAQMERQAVERLKESLQ